MPDKFLKGLLEKQKLEDEEIEDLTSKRDEVEKILREAFGTKPIIRYGGSKAKHTMIKESYDLDIVCYFPHDENEKKSLKALYEETSKVLNEKYIIEEKRSALRIKYLRNGIVTLDYHIDVVPGRFVKENSYDCFLYISNYEGERLKTNIEKHISHISESNCRDLIKLAKLWKVRHSISIRTFILEIFIVKIFEDYERGKLKSDFVYFLETLKDKIDNIVLKDPANDNNKVSDLLSFSDKENIKNRAIESLAFIKTDDEIIDDVELWHKVFDELYEQDEGCSEAVKKYSIKDLSLQDYNHREIPVWPALKNNIYKVKIDAYLYNNSKTKKFVKFLSNSRRIKNGFCIKFVATTNVPEPFKVYWQVVNTGSHAKYEKGERGEIFEGTKIQWESTSYTGLHWIECYIVKDEICYARERFHVRIKNPSWP